MKICFECKVEKPLNEFPRNNDYYERRCKPCRNTAVRAHRANNKDKVRAWNKRRNPGWDIDRYNKYVELQGNKCAICGTTEPGLSDWCCDHCHDSNKARGLLCVKCNAGLGYFRDNPEYLQSAIEYLKQWS